MSKTRLGLSAITRGKYGSFAGRTPEVAPTLPKGTLALLGVGR